MTNVIAERVRKVGGRTICSIGEIRKIQRISDNDANFVAPQEMLAELAADNRQVTGFLRQVHGVCEEHKDIVSTSLSENWIDESEHRAWFLFERPLIFKNKPKYPAFLYLLGTAFQSGCPFPFLMKIQTAQKTFRHAVGLQLRSWI